MFHCFSKNRTEGRSGASITTIDVQKASNSSTFHANT